MKIYLILVFLFFSNYVYSFEVNCIINKYGDKNFKKHYQSFRYFSTENKKTVLYKDYTTENTLRLSALSFADKRKFSVEDLDFYVISAEMRSVYENNKSVYFLGLYKLINSQEVELINAENYRLKDLSRYPSVYGNESKVGIECYLANKSREINALKKRRYKKRKKSNNNINRKKKKRSGI